jgi:hypothetical protein
MISAITSMKNSEMFSKNNIQLPIIIALNAVLSEHGEKSKHSIEVKPTNEDITVDFLTNLSIKENSEI